MSTLLNIIARCGRVLALLAILSIPALGQDDTVWVKTLSFDDITVRRGTWEFPDGNDTYRKILMYHTLKCDPRTAQDKYPCGEWDYLTYTFVNIHTGVMDSTAQTHPFFKVGRSAPDSVAYTLTPTHTTYQRYERTFSVDNVVSETAFELPTGTSQIVTEGGPARYQFPLRRSELRDIGLTGPTLFSGMQLYVNTPGKTLHRFTIRIKSTLNPASGTFDNSGFTTVLQRDVTFTSDGWNALYFEKPFPWTGSADMIVDISYEGEEGGPSPVLAARDADGGLISVGAGRYLEFDGESDYVDCGEIPELSGAHKATLEGWVRVDRWESWNKVFGVGDRFHMELGPNEGEVYCMVRNPDNTYGYATNAVRSGAWAHVAMVYDGDAAGNASRLRLYVNGRLMTLSYSGEIPAMTEMTDAAFTLTGLDWESASLDGALDEVRVWSDALDSATIGAWWNRTYDASHPKASSLLAYYSMNEGSGYDVTDNSGGNHTGRMIGIPEWRSSAATELVMNMQPMPSLPNMKLLKGTYETTLDSTLVSETVEDPPFTIATYEISNHRPVVKDIIYAWRSGYQYTYDPAGGKIDSTEVPADQVMHNSTLQYHGAPFEVVKPVEIGRFITPYGINLDLGPDGFTWIYDVTDYAPLLRGNVDISSGNQQELIDLRFAFIKGTPPRTVLAMNEISPSSASYSYAALSGNTVLKDTSIGLLPDAEQFKVRTRLTGHGHNSNDGSYPHCCEWKDNVHYLNVNDTTYQWHIFQYDDCALNPVYPQGGTWPGSREGWCPGDKVKDHDFEITRQIEGDQVKIDYDITKVPDDNQGMGGGNYVVTLQLFQYGPPSHQVDAEVYDVQAPTDVPYYSRRNPVCADPIVVVRNNGAAAITTLKFTYGVSGGTQQTYDWSGMIPPNEFATVTLPISGTSFWLGDGSNRFTVSVSQPNGEQDQYAQNDAHTTSFAMPDLFNEKVMIWYRTNRRPYDFSVRVLDINGNEVARMENLEPETLYKQELDLTPGCYTLEVIDPQNLGLSYWAVPDQGSGYIRLYTTGGTLLKSFNSDFGHGITYSFSIGSDSHVEDENASSLVAIFPNPAGDHARVVLDDYPMGASEIRLYDVSGRLIRTEQVEIGGRFSTQLDIRELPAGPYYITIGNGGKTLTKRFVKR